MRQLIELLLLIAFLNLGYAAARGGRRVFHDALVGSLWWVGVLGALVFLISFPSILVWVVRVGLLAAIVYSVQALAIWLVHVFAGVPHLHSIRRRHLLRALRIIASPDRETLRPALNEALGKYRRAVALNCVVDALVRRTGADQLAASLSNECETSARENDELAQRLAVLTGSDSRLDKGFTEGLVLRYGRAAVERALRQMEKDRHRVSRRRLESAARGEANDEARARILRELGVDVEMPRQRSERPVPKMGQLTSAANLFVPIVAYLVNREFLRAAVFGLSYVTALGYGLYLLRDRESAGWVFIAATGLLHLTALFHPGTAASAETARS